MTSAPVRHRIASPALAVTVSELGAEMQQLTDGDGRELLWDGDPAWWSGRAPILFPIVGALNGDHYRIGEAVYNLPKHGFARRSIFTAVDVGDSTITLRLTDSAETRAVYPFAFRLDIRFAVSGARFDVVASLINSGDTAMPASFGFHPAFRWPLPYGAPRAAHVVRFEHAEPEPIRRIDAAGLLTPVPRPTPVRDDTLLLDDALFREDALIFDQIRSRRLRYGVPGGTGLEIGFPDMPELGVWMKPGADYLCIEPWQGHADPAGYTGDFRDKPGIVILAPGETRDFTMRIETGVAMDGRRPGAVG